MEVQRAGKTRITTKEFTSKFKSKYEVYQLMYLDVGAYLPSSDCVTIYFLKDLATGKKKCKSYSLPKLFSSHQSERRPSAQCASVWGSEYRTHSREGTRASWSRQLSAWWAWHRTTASLIHRERDLHSDGWKVQVLGPWSHCGAQQSNCRESQAHYRAWPSCCCRLQRLSKHLK